MGAKKAHSSKNALKVVVNSRKTLLTEFNTHFVASYTLIEGGGCADTMTEGRRVIDLLS